jgi:hypothetical protein
MHAEELPFETAVVLGREHILERDVPCQWVASACADADADTLDRVKVYESHDVFSERAIDPGQCRFDCEASSDLAHSLRSRMESDRRHHRAQCQQDQPRSGAPELRIAFQRARNHRRRNGAARTVPDHDELVGVIRPGGCDEALRTDIDDLIEPGRPAACEPPQDHPATWDLDRSAPASNRLERKQRRDRGK